MKVIKTMTSLRILVSLVPEDTELDLELRRDQWNSQVMRLPMVTSPRINNSSMKVIKTMTSLRILVSLVPEDTELDLELKRDQWINLVMRLLMVMFQRINRSNTKVIIMMISLRILVSQDPEDILLGQEFRRDQWINQVMRLPMVMFQRINRSSMKVITMMTSLRILASLDLEDIELELLPKLAEEYIIIRRWVIIL